MKKTEDVLTNLFCSWQISQTSSSELAASALVSAPCRLGLTTIHRAHVTKLCYDHPQNDLVAALWLSTAYLARVRYGILWAHCPMPFIF